MMVLKKNWTLALSLLTTREISFSMMVNGGQLGRDV
jgi:hypothetical protein